MAKFFVSMGIGHDYKEVSKKKAINVFKKYFYLVGKAPKQVFDPSMLSNFRETTRGKLTDVIRVKTYYSCGCEKDSEKDNTWFFGANYYLSSKDTKKEVIRDLKNISSKEEVIEVMIKISYYGEDSPHSIINVGVAINHPCKQCIENVNKVAKMKEDMRPDSLLQQAIYSHGLATGFGMNEVTAEKAEENLVKFLRLSEDKEICCSWKNQQIGGFGMFVRGEVTIASNRDLWSYVGRSGRREFNVSEMKWYIINKKEDLDFEVWDHMEFFVKVKEFVGFWAKDWFIREVPGGREFVEKLRRMGHKVYITKPRHK